MGCPESYRMRDACVNCAHGFMLYDYDAGPEFFCLFGKIQKRPRCGSVALEESFFEEPDMDDVVWEKNEAAWEDYVRNRGVAAHGICDEYEDNNV